MTKEGYTPNTDPDTNVAPDGNIGILHVHHSEAGKYYKDGELRYEDDDATYQPSGRVRDYNADKTDGNEHEPTNDAYTYATDISVIRQPK